MTKGNPIEVPVWEKINLTMQEASAYSGIGINRLRNLCSEKNCNFVLRVGSKRMIKRKSFDEFLARSSSI